MSGNSGANGLVCLLLMAALHAAGDMPPGPRVRVEPVIGVPTFTVDGIPFLTPCFETYTPEERYFRQFAEKGVKLFCFNATPSACDYGHSKPVWPAADVWDYSGFDERMERVLAAAPDALVIPRVYIGTPSWWLEQNPDEMEVLDSGATRYTEPNRNPTIPKNRPFPSLASEKWRRDMGDALRRFIEHAQASKYGRNLFGYHLTGLDTEEWYHWSSGSDQLAGYSGHTRQAFRDWLERKYATQEALRAAWHDPVITFDSAATPSRDERIGPPGQTFRDPATAMNVVDFYLFYNDIIPETIDHFAAVARKATAGRKAIGAFYGYMYEFNGNPEFGHNALARFNASPNLDFIYVTASYSNRAFATGADYARSPAQSVRLHGKLWYHDNDVVSFLAPEVMKRVGLGENGDWSTSQLHHLTVLGYTDTPERTAWMYRRSLGFALCNGAYESYFDLHGGYYDDPRLMEEVATLNQVADTAATCDRSSCSEILVVADETSCAYAAFNSPMLEQTLRTTQPAFNKLGAPADHILLDDLPLLDPAPYKLVIFLNCWHMTAAQRAAIREKLMGGGRHLVWCYAPGYFEGPAASLDSMKTLTGFVIARAEQTLPLQIALCDDHYGPPDTVLGFSGPPAQLFYVDDADAQVGGVTPGAAKAVLAVKDMGEWTSIYTVTACLPPSVYRRMAQDAGVHIYNDRDDTLYANKSFLCVAADGAGPRTFRLPHSSNIVDMCTGAVIAAGTNSFTRDFQNGECVIFKALSSSPAS